MRRRRPLPYWLSGGSETCTLCEVVHVVEVTLRCTGCDRGFCRECVVVISETREAYCPDCGQVGAEEG